MEKVIVQKMNMKEVSRFSVIKEVIDGYLLVKDASIILSISQRWINVSHYTEMLNDNEGINISRESVRKILKSSNLIIDKYRHRSFRERMPKEGMLIQMDTSFHDWFSNNFFTTRHGGMHVKINEEFKDTQIQRSFKEIGINLIGARSTLDKR